MHIVYSLHTCIFPTSSGVTFTIIRENCFNKYHSDAASVILTIKQHNSNICTVVKVKVKQSH